MVEWFREDGADIILEVVVSPKASKNKIVGLHDGRLKIRITAPPVEGKANAELVRFLAKTLDLSFGQIEIESGHTSKKKTLRITGTTAATIEGLIDE